MEKEHSIEELKRQVHNAYSRLVESEKTHLIAQKRLHDRLCRESGYMGKIVTDNKGSVFVNDVEFMNDKPWSLKGFKIKSDGKVGEQIRRVYINRIVEVGQTEIAEEFQS